jgi:diguanylate cyclase (GGDEF)-like protein
MAALNLAVFALFGVTLVVLLRGRRADAARVAAQRRLARVDELTGAPNRRAGREALERERERLGRSGSRAGLLLIDVDRFKRLNDVHGYRCADDVLCEVFRRIARTVRKMDFVCRWGGEEFVVLAPDTTEDAVLALAERVRSAVCRDRIETRGVAVRVSVSIGAAAFCAGEDPLDCLQRANEALHQAKKTRDAVALAAPTSTARATHQVPASSPSP